MSPLKQSLNHAVDDNDVLPTHEALYHWIADHPDYADLVEQAKHNTPAPALSPVQTRIAWVKNLFFANPDEFYGRAYVTKELVEQSNVTARVVSGSGLVDFVSNYSLFLVTFRGMGLLSPILALILDALLLKFANDCAAGASGHKPSIRPWARAGLVGLVGINIIRTLVSGVGTEMLLNAPAISELKAQTLIVEHEQKIESLQSLPNPRLRQAKNDCEKGMADLKQMAATDPNRNLLIVRLLGSYQQQTQQDWGKVPEGQLPVCPLAERLQANALKNYETAKANWETLKLQRLAVGNDLGFLQTSVPELYRAHFEPNGEMKSGIEAAGFAAKNLLNKAMRGNWPELIMPGFVMLLSIVTSGTACYLTFTHARRPDTQRSRNSAVEQERDRWLEQQYQAISSARRTILHR
ncbi:MAG: hypothetical protein MH252_05855 [Thermosynechococcaceae cyanobacterium MS004]|nr:hypothetical protein [Thermosynechococcaceae cyanobacterium MS004]